MVHMGQRLESREFLSTLSIRNFKNRKKIEKDHPRILVYNVLPERGIPWVSCRLDILTHWGNFLLKIILKSTAKM